MSRSKIKVLFHSNYSKLTTGFGKNMRNIMLSLHNDEEIEVYEAANGIHFGSDPKTPWKCYGTYPSDSNILKQIHNSPVKQRVAGYGYYCIDKIIEEVKPDIYVGIEDVWAFKNFDSKDWWNKTKKIIWTTLDSLPILDEAVDIYNKCEQVLVWASFAENEMKKIGCEDVKTLHGAIDLKNFKPKKKRNALRKKFNLSEDFVVGFVFKNQLRKSVPNLLEGFKLFKKQNPKLKTKLLLHTGWGEKAKGWDIEKYIKEKQINEKDILCTYYCPKCCEYNISEYKGEELDCPSCGSKKSLKTKTSSKEGVSEKQLNEIYNLMDVYCHPFTSGGQELPIQEAKCSGLITLVTDYSCGEDSAYEHQGGLPLAWSEYREPTTQFIKASTCPKSIAENLTKVLSMDEHEKLKLIKNGRENIEKNFSITSSVNNLKKIIKQVDKIKIKEVADTKKEEGRDLININDLLGDEGPDNRLLVTMPESAGDVLMVNSLIENIKKTYPDKNIYVAIKNQFHSMINDNPFVHKIIPYSAKFDDLLFLEGQGEKYGYFKIAFLAHIPTQRKIQYIHNGCDKIQFFEK